MIAYNRSRSGEVASRVTAADSALARMRGLLGRDSMAPGEGLWIVPCSMIHTCFMRFDLDVLFLDEGLRVKRVMERLAPWRISPWVRGSRSALELPGGALQGRVREGDQLEIR